MKNLKRYWNRRVDNVVSLITITRNAGNANYYHDIRIEVKKIKALFELIRYHDRDFKLKKNLEPFRQLFERAGRIREIQIEKKLLKKYLRQSSSPYLAVLLSAQNDYDKSFNKIPVTQVVSNILAARNRVKRHIDELSVQAMEKYLVKMERKVMKKLSGELHGRVVHQLRKKLKTLHYNIDQVQPNREMMGGQHWIKFLDALGKWHDCEVAIRHLKKFVRKSKLKNVKVREVSNMLFNLTKEKTALLKRINRNRKSLC